MKNLKLLKLATLILFSLALVSCSSDDDGGPTGPTVSNDLYGNWNMLEYYEDVQNPVSEVPCEEYLEYKFNSDKTYTKKQFSGEDTNNCNEALTIQGEWEVIDESNILLTPAASSQSIEEFNFQLRNNGEELRVFRSNGITEEYRRP
ncbi:MAG: lipocalin family protein [Psychroflexus sp.]